MEEKCEAGQSFPDNVVRAVHTGRDGCLWLTRGLSRFENGRCDRPGHQGRHAFVWTAAAGMVEMVSLGQLNVVSAMGANGSFSWEKKSADDQHAALWTPRRRLPA